MLKNVNVPNWLLEVTSGGLWGLMSHQSTTLCSGSQAILANINTEAQRRALAPSRNAPSSVFTDDGDKEASLIAVQAAPA